MFSGRHDDRVFLRLVEAVAADEVAEAELGHGRRGHQIRHEGADVGVTSVAKCRRDVVIRAVAVEDGERIAGGDGFDPGEFVAAEEEVEEAAMVHELPSFSERELVIEAGDESMGHGRIRRALC